MVRMTLVWAGLLMMVVVCVPISQEHKIPGTVDVQGTDCTNIKTTSPSARSGLYTIQPPGAPKPFKVYCDMLENEGWTVIQRRTGGQVSFKQNWNAYKHGFGLLQKDHWLGLDKIWALTKDKNKNSILQVDLWDFEGGSSFAQYQNFSVGDEAAVYKLHIGVYSGNAGDAIRGAYSGMDQNGYGFSTFDLNNDGCSPCIFGDIAVTDCSRMEGSGGWWFSRCGSANLHGDWHPAGNNEGWASGLRWDTWKGPAPYSANATCMRIKSV